MNCLYLAGFIFLLKISDLLKYTLALFSDVVGQVFFIGHPLQSLWENKYKKPPPCGILLILLLF